MQTVLQGGTREDSVPQQTFLPSSAGQAGVCLFLCFRFMPFHSQSGAPLTSRLWELCLQVSPAWGLTPSAVLAHIKLDAVWWQQWRSLYRYLPFVLYFLRLLTSSLNVNQVFHLLFKTCFKRASTSSYAIKYALQSPDFFRNTIIFFWNFYLLINMAQFLLLRSSKYCRRSYYPWLAIWFTVSVACTPAFILLYPWIFFREALWRPCWEIWARYSFATLTEESPNSGQRKHQTETETPKKGTLGLLPPVVTVYCLYPA